MDYSAPVNHFKQLNCGPARQFWRGAVTRFLNIDLCRYPAMCAGVCGCWYEHRNFNVIFCIL